MYHLTVKEPGKPQRLVTFSEGLLAKLRASVNERLAAKGDPTLSEKEFLESFGSSVIMVNSERAVPPVRKEKEFMWPFATTTIRMGTPWPDFIKTRFFKVQ